MNPYIYQSTMAKWLSGELTLGAGDIGALNANLSDGWLNSTWGLSSFVSRGDGCQGFNLRCLRSPSERSHVDAWVGRIVAAALLPYGGQAFFVLWIQMGEQFSLQYLCHHTMDFQRCQRAAESAGMVMVPMIQSDQLAAVYNKSLYRRVNLVCSPVWRGEVTLEKKPLKKPNFITHKPRPPRIVTLFFHNAIPASVAEAHRVRVTWEREVVLTILLIQKYCFRNVRKRVVPRMPVEMWCYALKCLDACEQVGRLKGEEVPAGEADGAAAALTLT